MSSKLHLPDIFLQSPGAQSDLERALAKNLRGGGYPPALAPNVLAWWDAALQKDALYGITPVYANSFESGVTDFTSADSNILQGTTTVKYGTKAAELSIGAGGTAYRDINDVSIVSTKKYFYTAWIYLKTYVSGNYPSIHANDYGGFVNGVASPTVGTVGVWTRVSLVFTGKNKVRLRLGAYSTENWTAIYDGLQLIPISDIFGPGNEPTAAEMEAILAADGNQYWEGSRNVICNPRKYLHDSFALNSIPINGNFETNTDGWNQGDRSSERAYVGTYSVKNAGYNTQEITGLTAGEVVYITEYHYLQAITSGILRLGVYDAGTFANGVTQIWDNAVLGTWVLSVVRKTVVTSGIRVCLQADDVVDGTSYRDGIMFFRGTAIFGAGNEPTAADFATILAGAPAYWEGSQTVANPFTQKMYYAYDNSGNARHAKLYNMAYTAASGPQAGPPKHWKGDGVDDWMGRAEPGFIAQDADFSYVCMVRPSANNVAFDAGVTQTAKDVLNFCRGIYYDTGRYYSTIIDRVAGQADASFVVATLSSRFDFLCVTYSSADKKLRLYYNGDFKYASPAIGVGHAAFGFVSNSRNWASTAFSAYDSGLDGWFNKTLSDAEVLDIHNRNKTRFGIA